MHINYFISILATAITPILMWLFCPIFSLSWNKKGIKYYYTHPEFKTKIVFPDIFSKGQIYLSIVIPAYNESKRIEKTLDRTLKFLKARNFSWEMIVVNDGSSDNTTSVVIEWTKRNLLDTQRIRPLDYTLIHGNMGKGFAVKTGMLRARGRYVLFMDADGASSLEGIDRLLSKMKECETDPDNAEISLGVVCGSRAHMVSEVDRTRLRAFLMHGFHFCVSLIGGVHNIQDTQCGFKLFTREAVRRIFPSQKLRRWCFDVELINLANWQSIPVVERYISWKEIPGSKMSPLRDAVFMLRELIVMRFCYVLGIWKIEFPHRD